MKALTKTTMTFAAKRGLFLEMVEADEFSDTPRVWIYENEDDCEPMLSYTANVDGTFSYFDNLSLPQEICEELPGTLRDEKHLREMIAFIASELAA